MLAYSTTDAVKKVPSSPSSIPKHSKSAVALNRKNDAIETEAKAGKDERGKRTFVMIIHVHHCS